MILFQTVSKLFQLLAGFSFPRAVRTRALDPSQLPCNLGAYFHRANEQEDSEEKCKQSFITSPHKCHIIIPSYFCLTLFMRTKFPGSAYTPGKGIIKGSGYREAEITGIHFPNCSPRRCVLSVRCRRAIKYPGDLARRRKRLLFSERTGLGDCGSKGQTIIH